MNSAHLFKEFRKSINPPYQAKDLLVVALTLLILAAIPLTVIGLRGGREPVTRAAFSNPTIYLLPAANSVNQNTNFDIQIREDSLTNPVNGVQANLTYDATKLDFVSISNTGSAFGIEAQNYGSGGLVKIARAVNTDQLPVTNDQLVATVTFKAKTGLGQPSVQTTISFTTGTAVVRSTDNVDILVDKIPGTYTIVDPPPTVTITTPANNSTIKGTSVAVQATASDDLAVTKVEFYVDSEASPRSTVTASPYQYTLNTLSPVLSDGAHTIKAKAYDASSSTTATINVIVDNNAPTVSISYPANNAYVKSTVTVTVTQSDTIGVTRVEYYLDGAGTPTYTTTTSPFSFPWNTTAYSNATHTLQAKAYDNASNVGTSSTIAVTVDNVNPTVSIGSPANGAYLKGSVSATATPADTNLLNVEFYRSGTASPICTVATPGPYTCANILTTSNSDGSYTISAKANDKAGNNTTASVTVTYDNTAPSAPTGLTANPASSTQINLTWTASNDPTSGVAGYDIYRNGTKVNPTLVTTTSYNDNGLTVNTNYCYTVKAIDRSGNVSADSSQACATTRKRSDINGDGVVNIFDLSILLTNYESTTYPAADINKNGTVDIFDLSMLLTDYEG